MVKRHHGPELAVRRGNNGRRSRHVVHERQLAEAALLNVLTDLLAADDDVVRTASVTVDNHQSLTSLPSLPGVINYRPLIVVKTEQWAGFVCTCPGNKC